MAEAPVDDAEFLHELIKTMQQDLNDFRSATRVKLDTMSSEITKLKVAQARVETKVGLWAAGGGGGAVGVAEVLRFVL